MAAHDVSALIVPASLSLSGIDVIAIRKFLTRIYRVELLYCDEIYAF